MLIRLLAVGRKMPAWVDQGYHEYARRISGDCRLTLHELPMQKRGKSASIARIRQKETQQLLASVKAGEMLVALDVTGKTVSTEQLAAIMTDWQMSGRNIALAVGGPDGMDDELLQQAEQVLSLSRLTLPHPLVRVLLAEQLYRAWSINHGHPYHR